MERSTSRMGSARGVSGMISRSLPLLVPDDEWISVRAVLRIDDERERSDRATSMLGILGVGCAECECRELVRVGSRDGARDAFCEG